MKHGLHSRLWVLGATTLLATPLAALVLYYPPPTSFYFLAGYYFCAEAWFSILFTVIVEISEASVRSTSIGMFLFVMNNIGGNLPVIVDPIQKTLGYREAIYIVWAGSLGVSAIIFFASSLPLWLKERRSSPKSEK